MNYQQAVQTVQDWKETNPEKFQAWEWFGMGIKKAEFWQCNHTDIECVMPFQKAVGEFSQEYDFWHREQNPDQYNQDMPEFFHLRERTDD
jgi:hypothetical protein